MREGARDAEERNAGLVSPITHSPSPSSGGRKGLRPKSTWSLDSERASHGGRKRAGAGERIGSETGLQEEAPPNILVLSELEGGKG